MCAYRLTCARNGALVANLAAGASEAEFLEAMRKAPVPGEEPDVQSPPLAADTPASSSSSSASPAPIQDRNAVYEERKARMEQRRVAEEKEEREKRLARERTRRESITADPPGRSSNTTYLEQQRKRQLAAQEERQRVLRLLENDKIERRQREAKRKQALAEDHDGAPPGPAAKENIPQKSPTPRPTGTETALSFRLLDGSSLKTKFPSLSLLGTDVRQWLDANRNDGDHPYSFLQILAPLPNKQLSISDENSSLSDLGLSPTATLVLVPAQSYTTAYSGGGTSTETGILAKAYSMFYGAVTTVLGVGYPTRTPPAPAPPAAPPAPPAPPAPLQPAPTPRAAPAPSRPGTSSGGLPMSRTNSGNGRIRTLYDGEARAEPDGGGRKYYNGNQVRNPPHTLSRRAYADNPRCSWTLNRSRRKGRGKRGRSRPPPGGRGGVKMGFQLFRFRFCLLWRWWMVWS